jgi:drug/metabolite transporter (DMT)-like permease
MSHRIKILLGYIIICLIWGSSWAAVKLGLETVPPVLSISIRFAIASVILGFIIFIQRLAMPRDWNFWRLVSILCATAFTIPFIIIYWAQIRVDSGLASVLFATYPFWVAIISNKILPNEKITTSRVTGMIVGFIGIVIIFYDGFVNLDRNSIYGMIAIIGASIIQAYGLIAIRKYGANEHSINMNFYPMMISAIILSILSYNTENYTDVVLNVDTLASIMYLSIFCTVITFVIYFWLVKYVEVVVLSLSALITPIVAVIIAVLIMGEKFTNNIFIGSLLVLAGVGISNRDGIESLYRQAISRQ